MLNLLNDSGVLLMIILLEYLNILCFLCNIKYYSKNMSICSILYFFIRSYKATEEMLYFFVRS